MATVYSLSEQVWLKLYGGAPKVSSPVQISDIKLAVVQTCNALLKIQHFDTMRAGENYPEGLCIATYPKVPLTTFGGKKSKCTLPATPVGLIRNQGVWQVSKTESFDCLLIPMMSGQADLLNSQDIISSLMGQTGYTIDGTQLTTTEDLTINNVDGLYIRLIITDISKLTDYTPLPIPADFEATIVQRVYETFAPTPTPIRVNDNFAANAQTQNIR